MHTGQSVAQKLTSMTFPGAGAMLSPLSEMKVTRGAGVARSGSRNAAAATARPSTTARMAARLLPGEISMLRILSGLAMIVISAPAAASLDRISNADQVSGLKQALNDGSIAAVAKLGVQNGFLGNPRVKIPLPPSIQRVEGAMRAFGMSKQADDLVHSMNRAAETAVVEARPLLVDAVKKMRSEERRVGKECRSRWRP